MRDTWAKLKPSTHTTILTHTRNCVQDEQRRNGQLIVLQSTQGIDDPDEDSIEELLRNPVLRPC